MENPLSMFARLLAGPQAPKPWGVPGDALATTATNPVGWSSTAAPQYMSNPDPSFSELARKDNMTPQQAVGAMLLGKGRPITNAQLPAAEAKAQTFMDYGMTVAGAVNPVGIRAFHGSPHTFDRFDMSKLGTGEGAQAYGHGLYFAGNEGVARTYKTAGANPFNSPASVWLKKADGDFSKALQMFDDWTKALDLPTTQAQEEVRAVLRKGTNPGSMYEVNLRTSPERLLDWDKPLAGQSDAVREALKSVPWGEPYANSSVLTGGQVAPKTLEGTAQLRQAGIDGIQYLDGGSRAAGDGTRNYVMFDDKLIDILRRYGLLGLVGGGAAAAGSNPAEAKQ